MFAGEGASRFSDTAARLPPLSLGARALVTALTPGKAVNPAAKVAHQGTFVSRRVGGSLRELQTSH